MTNFDVPAELYPGRSHKGGRTARYQRFPSLAEAVRYTLEELPAGLQQGSLVEADEIRYDGDAIRDLYYSDAYPLRRAFLSHARAGRTS